MKLTNVNRERLRELKSTLRLPMNRIVNDILEKHFTGKLKEVSAMKVTEVEVMVSKKISVNFNSCCVCYTAKAVLDENDQNHLDALAVLKDQLVNKVQEALNGKRNGNGNGNGQNDHGQTSSAGDSAQGEGANGEEVGHA
ncbi:MAG: hypothetical protein JXA41_12830 [Deltaproteobacteria bacterium]|nr:hypothetical protein [Deltaproteobacteria bacterium]